MKNKKYIIGFLSSIFIISGGVFKVMHWPGASMSLIIGMILLCIAFLPAAIISSYKDGGKKKGGLYVVSFLTILIVFTGILFKIMHWPGAGILVIAGVITPIVLFLPVYLYHHFKEQEESNVNFLFIMFLLVYVSVMSTLLALNPTKSLLNDSRDIVMMASLDKYHELKEEFDEHGIPELREQTNQLTHFIDSLRKETAMIVGKENKATIQAEGSLNVMHLYGIDNMDAANYIMLAKGHGKELQKKLDDYKKMLKHLSNKNQVQSHLAALDMINTSGEKTYDNQHISWEASNFENLPLIFVLQKLEHIKNNVLMAEKELVFKVENKKLAKI